MSRALELARRGSGFVSPNPMVGAVITTEEQGIIGEGWHAVWGGPHAEVNAVASVADKQLLRQATIYVTLEPCAHYGKTPPCAKLLVDCGFKRVVIGTADPFASVCGKGVQMLREAGIRTEVGLMEEECRHLNRRFFTAHTLHRPYILLKWAQTADGFIARADGSPVRISSPLTQVLMHKVRSEYDAIMVGTDTVINDNPSLTCRLWPHRRLIAIVPDRHGRIPADAKILHRTNDRSSVCGCINGDSTDFEETIILTESTDLKQMTGRLYSEHGITSLMVEGGAKLLNAFLDSGLYDEIRIETGSKRLGTGIKAPTVNTTTAACPQCDYDLNGHTSHESIRVLFNR